MWGPQWLGMAGTDTLSPMLRQDTCMNDIPGSPVYIFWLYFPDFPQMVSAHFLSILQETRQKPVADGTAKMLGVRDHFHAVFKWNCLVSLGRHATL